MAVRLWTALLVLVGMFVVHGAQCMTAADGAGHPTTAAHTAVLAPTGTLMHDAVEATTVTAAAGITPISALVGDTEPADTAPVVHSATGSPAAVAVSDAPAAGSHGTAGHLWTVCLAVLAAALAVLLAVLLPHPRLVSRVALLRVLARLKSLSLARPPDLSELCLLRI